MQTVMLQLFRFFLSGDYVTFIKIYPLSNYLQSMDIWSQIDLVLKLC